MDLDLASLVKIYTPVIVSIAGIIRLYFAREKKREKRHEKAIVEAIAECESERKADRDECSAAYEKLQERLHEVELNYMREMGKAFNRMADSVDTLARSRNGGTETHHRKESA